VFAILAKNNIIMRTQIKILFTLLFFSGLINAQVTQISQGIYLHPWELVSTGNVLYFNAYDGIGSRLYSSDGTNVTHIEIPGNIDPNPIELTPYGNDLYFVVSAGMSNSNQLWKYSYTTNTVEQIIYSTYTFGLGTQELYVLGNNLFFDGRDNNGDSQLWKYDGVNSIVIPLNVPAYFNEPCNMTAVGSTLFLNAYGEQLWKYDGNVAEQIPFVDNAEELTPHGSDIFFNKWWTSQKLYKYD
jgi:hypothetical protein